MNKKKEHQKEIDHAIKALNDFEKAYKDGSDKEEEFKDKTDYLDSLLNDE